MTKKRMTKAEFRRKKRIYMRHYRDKNRIIPYVPRPKQRKDK